MVLDYADGYGDPTPTVPFTLPSGRHARGEDTADTEPIPLPPDPLQTEGEGAPMPVKVAERCGACGSSLSLEWSGRVDTLRVLRDWRATHRCRPESSGPE